MCGMAARRRADIHEVKSFMRQQSFNVVVPDSCGAGLPKDPAARREGDSGGDDHDVIARLPCGQMCVRGYISKANECASEHAIAPQSRPNLRAMAAND